MHGDGGFRVARRACTKCSRMIIRGCKRERLEKWRTKREREKERKRETEKERERDSKNT